MANRATSGRSSDGLFMALPLTMIKVNYKTSKREYSRRCCLSTYKYFAVLIPFEALRNGAVDGVSSSGPDKG